MSQPQTLLDEQTAPIPNEGEAIANIVIREYGHIEGLTGLFEIRKQQGIERYGVALQPFNGRDAQIDALQEAVDLTVYLRQLAEERRLSGQDPTEAMAAYHQAVFMVRRVLKLGAPDQ
ncbi:MAG TPA: hypothetical protein V6C88_10345 [Chroococcidiopsis sp.]